MSLTEFLVYCGIVLNKIIVCMKRFSILAVLAVLAALAVSCGGSGKKLLPNVSGKAGEVIVVINQTDWEGEVGDALRELLASDCPFLPQREPLYTLVNITPSALKVELDTTATQFISPRSRYCSSKGVTRSTVTMRMVVTMFTFSVPSR